MLIKPLPVQLNLVAEVARRGDQRGSERNEGSGGLWSAEASSSPTASQIWLVSSGLYHASNAGLEVVGLKTFTDRVDAVFTTFQTSQKLCSVLTALATR